VDRRGDLSGEIAKTFTLVSLRASNDIDETINEHLRIAIRTSTFTLCSSVGSSH
jgi:hypothetical protein